MELGPKSSRNITLWHKNTAKYRIKITKTWRKETTSSVYCGSKNWSDLMTWCVVSKLLPWGYLLDRHYLTANPACRTAGTVNVQLHSSKGLNTSTVKRYRRRVWETRHSGATGWELLSHFSGVWCSSLLHLTRGSNWQRESLFRCQMWPHWTYVSNNVIRKENKLRLT